LKETVKLNKRRIVRKTTRKCFPLNLRLNMIITGFGFGCISQTENKNTWMWSFYACFNQCVCNFFQSVCLYVSGFLRSLSICSFVSLFQSFPRLKHKSRKMFIRKNVTALRTPTNTTQHLSENESHKHIWKIFASLELGSLSKFIIVWNFDWFFCLFLCYFKTTK